MFIENRKRFIELMENGSIAVFDSGQAPHITTDQFYPYSPNRSFYYLTGLNVENCRLMIIKNKKQFLTFLFVEETTEYMRKWVGEKMSKETASETSGIVSNRVFYLSEFDGIFRNAMLSSGGFGFEPPSILYLDLYRYKVNVKPYALSQFKDLIEQFKELRIVNANGQLAYLRMFKNEFEIKQISSAISITNVGLNRVMKELKNRSNESQIAADFLHEITLNGSEGKSFNTIAASGKNATVLHYEDNNAELKQGNLLLCDLGALYQNYAADISRTYPISGVFSKRQKDLYAIVLKANKMTIDYVKPGITWKDLNAYAKSILIKECKAIGLIESDEEITKYYTHSIGHFLGLDVHDIGIYNKELLEGMIITIEPGLYIKEEGIGIRIEDNILITKEGCINLSESIIKEIEDIEKYMK